MPRLVLFDIDETMISSGGAGRKALEQALAHVLGKPIISDGHSFSGKTDPQICNELLEKHGYSPDEIKECLPSVLETYLPLLQLEVDQTKHSHVHVGVEPLLHKLEKVDDAYLALLTGNIEVAARIKLKPFDLNRFFSCGAYGSDSANRMELPLIAHHRAQEQFRKNFAINEIVVIGDSCNDVLCAQGYGARSIAVCTGKTPKQALADLKPDYLFDTLSDTQQVVQAICAE